MKGIGKGRTAVSPLLWGLYINLNPVLRPPGRHFVLPHQPLPRNLNTDKLLPQSMRIELIPIYMLLPWNSLSSRVQKQSLPENSLFLSSLIINHKPTAPAPPTPPPAFVKNQYPLGSGCADSSPSPGSCVSNSKHLLSHVLSLFSLQSCASWLPSVHLDLLITFVLFHQPPDLVPGFLPMVMDSATSVLKKTSFQWTTVI